jgi:hypothetical protein
MFCGKHLSHSENSALEDVEQGFFGQSFDTWHLINFFTTDESIILFFALLESKE